MDSILELQSYFQKHALYPPLVQKIPSKDLDLIVVIPSYHEEGLMRAIQSLLACHVNEAKIEIIVVLNQPESQNAIQSYHELQRKELMGLKATGAIEILDLPVFSLPNKAAGVGLARKIGMDEACYRFESIQKDGIILCFDADCTCHPNYLQEVREAFKKMPKINALSIGFKHRMDELNEFTRDAIIQYELHLRTYIGWQQYFNYSMAFQTLGSCMAVRSKAYQQQGGMNKRKAGEDFYFLHKYSVLGQLAELKPLLVYPSGRISDRVPFGTGKSVNEIVKAKVPLMSYNPNGIKCYCNFYTKLCDSWSSIKEGNSWRSIPSSDVLTEFLVHAGFEEALSQDLNHSTTKQVFASRIGRFLNPFRLMKFLHAASGSDFPEIPVQVAATKLLLAKKEIKELESLNSLELLQRMQL